MAERSGSAAARKRRLLKSFVSWTRNENTPLGAGFKSGHGLLLLKKDT